jgi:hypothetical protein
VALKMNRDGKVESGGGGDGKVVMAIDTAAYEYDEFRAQLRVLGWCSKRNCQGVFDAALSRRGS